MGSCQGTRSTRLGDCNFAILRVVGLLAATSIGLSPKLIVDNIVAYQLLSGLVALENVASLPRQLVKLGLIKCEQPLGEIGSFFWVEHIDYVLVSHLSI